MTSPRSASRLGVGIIGCGAMGSWHALNLARQPGVSVVAVADAFLEPASRLAAGLNAEVRPAHELIGSPDVDAVVIASSEDSHAEYAVAAIGLGKDSFLEKPIATNAIEAAAVLDAEVAAGRRLVRVGFMREADPAHRQVREACLDLGPPTRVRCVHRNVDTSLRPVGALFAQSLIHDIHTIRWLSAQEFLAVTVHVVERGDGFRDVLLVGELSGGALGTIDFEDQAFGYEVHVEVTAEYGIAATVPHPRVMVKRSGAESVNIGADWFARFEDAYRIELEEWTTAIRGGDEVNGPSLWDGYAAQVVAGAGEQAFRAGGRVVVEMPQRPYLYNSNLNNPPHVNGDQ